MSHVLCPNRVICGAESKLTWCYTIQNHLILSAVELHTRLNLNQTDKMRQKRRAKQKTNERQHQMWTISKQIHDTVYASKIAPTIYNANRLLYKPSTQFSTSYIIMLCSKASLQIVFLTDLKLQKYPQSIRSSWKIVDARY